MQRFMNYSEFMAHEEQKRQEKFQITGMLEKYRDLMGPEEISILEECRRIEGLGARPIKEYNSASRDLAAGASWLLISWLLGWIIATWIL
jgi:hypothetical protein